MSILVKDVDMPERCAKCFLKSICDKRIYMERRPEYCPLIELPAHGRLIDADEFVKRHKDWYCENCERRKNSKGRFAYEIGGAPCRACDIGDMIDAVDGAPTIIEADYPPSTPLKQVWTELFGEECE